jgi:uncharacterized cupin superfamily protein
LREALPMPNIFEPDFKQRRDHPGFRALRARLGSELATQRLGASVWEIEPGEAAYPYHYHLAEEELLIVLLGRPSVPPTASGASSSPVTCCRSRAARPARIRWRTGAT